MFALSFASVDCGVLCIFEGGGSVFEATELSKRLQYNLVAGGWEYLEFMILNYLTRIDIVTLVWDIRIICKHIIVYLCKGIGNLT